MPSLNVVEPISDDEDGCEGDDLSDYLNGLGDGLLEEGLTLTQTTTQRKQARRKQSWNKTSETQDDGDNGLLLPEWQSKRAHRCDQAGFGKSQSCQMDLRLVNCNSSKNSFPKKKSKKLYSIRNQ